MISLMHIDKSSNIPLHQPDCTNSAYQYNREAHYFKKPLPQSNPEHPKNKCQQTSSDYIFISNIAYYRMNQNCSHKQVEQKLTYP